MMKLKKNIPLIDQHDKFGFWGGKFGGSYIPETLKKPVDDLTKEFSKLRNNNSNVEISESYNNNHFEFLDLVVNGMTCSHCKESVESSIKSIYSNAETFIDLSSGKVEIKGLNLDEHAIKEKIEGRGFTVELQ